MPNACSMVFDQVIAFVAFVPQNINEVFLLFFVVVEFPPENFPPSTPIFRFVCFSLFVLPNAGHDLALQQDRALDSCVCHAVNPHHAHALHHRPLRAFRRKVLLLARRKPPLPNSIPPLPFFLLC